MLKYKGMKNTTYLLLSLLVVSFFTTIQSFAQTDTLFWFVAPEVTSDHGDTPIYLRLSTQNAASTVTVSQPANPGFPVQTVTIPPNQTNTLDLTAWLNDLENKPADQVLNLGLKIESTTEVDAYYEVNRSNNPDIFTLKGKNALGTSFFIGGQDFWNSGDYTPTATSSFDIVATEDNTTVTITPSNALIGNAAGTPYTVNLNQGQTYSGVASNANGNQNVTGTKVDSDKPIAITYSDDSNRSGDYGGCRDLQGDQLVPISIVGTEYILIRGFLGGPDRAFITATENNTQIFVDGNAAPVATINTGETHMVLLNQPSTFIETSNPAYMYHTSGYGCEVGGALLPPIECTGSDQVGFTRATNENFGLLLIVLAGQENDFLLNGNAGIITAADFDFVPGTNNEWMFARIEYGTGVVPDGQSTLVTNTSGVFHLAIINGSESGGCRYGYFSDFASINLEAVTAGGNVCEGDSIQLFADSISGATYEWTGPSGFQSTDQNPLIPNAAANNEGIYTVVVEVDNCTSIPTETDPIEVYPLPIIAGTTTDEICQNEAAFPLSYFNPVGGNYSGNGVDNDSLFPQLTDIGGSYIQYIFEDENGCSAQDSLLLTIHPIYFDTITVSSCDNYTWNSTGETYTASGEYIFEGLTTEGCDSVEVLDLTIFPLPDVNAGLDQEICEGDSISVLASGAQSYSWDNNVNNGDFISPEVGSYTYTVTGSDLNGCENTDEFNLLVQPVPEVNFTANPEIGDAPLTVDFSNNSTPGTQFTWDFGNGNTSTAENPSQTFEEPGIYPVILIGELEGCVGLDTSEIIVEVRPPSFEVPNVFTANNDNTNDIFMLKNIINGEFITDFSCIILNRWGNEIQRFEQLDFEWDGTTQNGEPATEGVYFYQIQYNVIGDEEGKMHHGFVQLVRD